ncbi:MAG: alpha/beta fold hydrolase [Pararhodobacter sp.]
MSPSARQTRIATPHGMLAVHDSGGTGPALVLIHGNSSCKEVFAHQFDAPELAQYRRVAFDLPGHGASDDAVAPELDYTFAGYAQALEAVIEALELSHPAVFGWSLGGHVALEALGRGADLSGIMISGTPPVTPTMDCLMAAFNIDPAAENLTAKREFTDADAQAYALHTAGTGGMVDAHLLAMVKRTDGRAREIMFGAVVAGMPLDECAILTQMQVPLAVVNGAEDPFIRHDYFDTLDAPSLWAQGMVRLPGAGHAPFLQAPAAFNPLLAAFLASL